MTEHERNQPRGSEEDDDSLSTGWSARWDAEALGEVRMKAKAQQPSTPSDKGAAD